MQKHEKEALAAVRAILVVDGYRCETDHNTAHMKIRVVGTGAFVTVSGSPRDRDQCVNHAKQFARKILRELRSRRTESSSRSI